METTCGTLAKSGTLSRFAYQVVRWTVPKKPKPRYEKGMALLAAGLVAFTVLVGIKLFQEGDRVAITEAHNGAAPVTRAYAFILLVCISLIVSWYTYKDWKHDRDLASRRAKRRRP